VTDQVHAAEARAVRPSKSQYAARTTRESVNEPGNGRRERSRRAIADRLGLGGLDYEIPREAQRWTHLVGGLTAFFILLLILSGVYLGQFYDSTPTGAHDSVLYIITRAPLGDWVRSVHYFSAGGAVAAIVTHLVLVFRRRAYRRPREVTWWAGVGMAGLLFLLVVTGSPLRYDQEGFEALAHFVAASRLTSGPGRFFTADFTSSTSLLSRVFSLHMSLLPIVLVALIGLHFWLIRQLGIASTDEPRTVFRRHAVRLTAVSLLAFAALGALAAVAPEGLGYSPVAGVEITKPFWPVLWIYGLENLLGAWGMVVGPLIVFVFLAAVPLLDRRAGGAGSGWVGWTGAAVALAVFGLWLYGVFGRAQQHIGM
jgi:ubiquinol-cytochrome c reductase cytochrome b subunit